MATKKIDYLYKLIQDPVSTWWHGEVWINGALWKNTLKMVNQKVVATRINKIIESYNAQQAYKSARANLPLFDLNTAADYQLIIPAEPDDEWKTNAPKPKKMSELPVITMRKEEPTRKPETTIPTKMNQQETQTVNIKTQRKKVTPRKPFTPYGLNGYLVDKNGKVRLMLDRKANAKTITLEPEMFAMLANMVQATQAQEMKNE